MSLAEIQCAGARANGGPHCYSAATILASHRGGSPARSYRRRSTYGFPHLGKGWSRQRENQNRNDDFSHNFPYGSGPIILSMIALSSGVAFS